MPSRFQDLPDRRRDVLVLALNQPRPHLDDGDFAAEPPEHLPELEPDVAAAHDDQVLREKVDAPSSSCWSDTDLVEPGHRGHDRAPAHVDEDPLGASSTVVAHA